MKRPHLILANEEALGHGIRTYNSPHGGNSDTDEEVTAKDYTFQRETFKHCYNTFRRDIHIRQEQRDSRLKLPHFQYIQLLSFTIIDDKTLTKWGLTIVLRDNLGMRTLALIHDEDKFRSFMSAVLGYAEDDNIR